MDVLNFTQHNCTKDQLDAGILELPAEHKQKLSELLTFTLTGSRVVNFDRNFNRQTTNLILSAVLQLRFFSGDLR